MKDEVNKEELKEAARETYRRLQNELERKVDVVMGTGECFMQIKRAENA